MEIKPIKRSRQLTFLSKDHHEGLLLVWKIRQGTKNGTGHQVIEDYVKWFWEAHLDEHFRQEEEVLAPAMEGNPLVERMFREHDEIRALLAEGLENAERLEKFAVLLNDHIRFEERELFGEAERLIPEEKLDEIESRLVHTDKQCGSWENEFWLKK